jgi:hypothetical protein
LRHDSEAALLLGAALILLVGCGDERAAGPPAAAAPAPSAAPAPASAPRAELPHRLFPTAAAALEHVLERTRPRIVGFGEFHQQEATRSIRSTLERFSRDLLPGIAPRTSDLVVEAWVSSGECGDDEREVVAEVEQVSRRPAATENENLSLLKAARSLGVEPHILRMSCADYRRVVGGEAGLDYFALLELVGQRLERKGLAVHASRSAESREGLIALFGGAVHNDLEPAEDFAAFSFGPGIDRAIDGRYVEVDLLVPEFVAASDDARGEQWYALFDRLVAPDRAVLIERGPRSFVIGFPTGVTTAERPAPVTRSTEE